MFWQIWVVEVISSLVIALQGRWAMALCNLRRDLSFYVCDSGKVVTLATSDFAFNKLNSRV